MKYYSLFDEFPRMVKRSAVILVVILFHLSCKKIIEVKPPSSNLNAGNVYSTDATASAVLTNIYAQMSSLNNGVAPLLGQDITSISLCASLGADELVLFNLNELNILDFYRNDLSIYSGLNYWTPIYQQIFKVNNAIEGLNASTGLTPKVKQQLLGEAKFIRGFCYFYLVNMYGDVPLPINTDWKINALLPRTAKAQVYQQIIADLKDAQGLLYTDYLKGDALTPYPLASAERVRPNKWAATALLARVYLYNGNLTGDASNFTNAESQATNVINTTALYDTVPLINVFLKNNKEAIWQLQPVLTGTQTNTGEGAIFVLPAGGPNTTTNPVYLSNNIVNAFESGDSRKTNWINNVTVGTTTYYYPYKYKIGKVTATTQEYPTILRLGEQFLIRAEARAQLGNINGAQLDLNVIRKRAGLSNTAANDKNGLITAILQERKVELFAEWGHRWFDLKRTNNIDAVMALITPQKANGSAWRSFQALYPIPQADINSDPNLIQNPGY